MLCLALSQLPRLHLLREQQDQQQQQQDTPLSGNRGTSEQACRRRTAPEPQLQHRPEYSTAHTRYQAERSKRNKTPSVAAEHSRPDERRALEKAPACLHLQYLPSGRASHELPWSFVPAAVAPILTRAGVRLLRQEPPPLAHLKKGQPSAVLPSLHTHHGCPARLLCHKTPCDHHPLNSRYRGRQLHTPQQQWIPICAPSSTCC